MVTVKALSLEQRAGIAVDYWRRSLQDWADALLAELRATTEDERRGAASLLIPVHALAMVVAGEIDALRVEVNALIWRGSRGWRAVPAEARQLPADQLLADLVAAADPARVLAARLVWAKQLVPVCERLGLFGNHARDVATFVDSPTAYNFLVARRSAQVGDAASSGAVPP